MSCFIRILPLLRFSGEIVHWALELEEVKGQHKTISIFHCKDIRRVNSHKGPKLSSTGETYRFIMILNRFSNDEEVILYYHSLDKC